MATRSTPTTASSDVSPSPLRTRAGLLIGLLLQVVDRPTGRHLGRRARAATTAFLAIYPDPLAAAS